MCTTRLYQHGDLCRFTGVLRIVVDTGGACIKLTGLGLTQNDAPRDVK